MAEEAVVKKRKVMVALDGSEFSRQAFDFAVGKIFRPEKDLVVLFNVRAASGDAGAENPILEEYKKLAEEKGLEHVTIEEKGDPREAIISTDERMAAAARAAAYVAVGSIALPDQPQRTRTWSASSTLSTGLTLRRNDRCVRQASRSPMWVCAMDASFSDEPPKVFPRIGTRDPYKRLGLGRDASTEEITEAKNYLVEEYKGHERSREAIEEAFDKIIAEKFRERRKSKINLKADLKKKVAEAPPWIQALIDMVDVPKPAVIAQRAVLFALIAVWSIMNPAEGGPAFQVAVALGLSVYLINERLKSITRALIIGFATLVVGWITGSFLVPFIPEGIFPGFWSLELGTSLVTYVFLWFSTTFLK
ncbi:unnamed protein product [Closterium sp. Yama58-4]|nr:unnamed protein product [Closterium sp. Yama58-4]